MRYARRLAAAVVGCAMWLAAVATATLAAMLPDPPSGGDQWWRDAPATRAPETWTWPIVTMVALGVVLVLALVGLFYSLRHSRMARTSRMTGTPHGTHA